MNLERKFYTHPNKDIYLSDGKIIKVFHESYSKADVLNEALNTARVEETGLNIPCLHEVTVIDGRWAVVSDFVEGKTMQQLMEEQPERMPEWIDRFVSIQLEVQQHTCPLLNDMAVKLQKRIAISGLSATMRYDLLTRLGAMHAHHKLCHGDFNPSNVIITPDDKAYVIDWAHATQGNASADAALTYMLFCLEGKKDVAEMYMQAFCRKSDTVRQYVQKWVPIVAAAQLSKHGLTPEETELLKGWVV